LSVGEEYIIRFILRPKKRILTITTCTAAAYLAEDLCNIPLSFLSTTDTRTVNLSSSDPKYKQLKGFLGEAQISIPSPNGQKTKIIRGLVERIGNFAFSKNNG
jgi:hypothetical protein